MEKEQVTVNDRIKILINTLVKKTSEFTKATGLTSQNISDLTSAKRSAPSFATITKILIAYPEINERWLLVGEGEMLKSQQLDITDLHSGEATVEYATRLASNGLLRELVESQAKTIATQDAALSTKDEVIALLKEELKKFGGSSYAALLELLPQLLPTGAGAALVSA